MVELCHIGHRLDSAVSADDNLLKICDRRFPSARIRVWIEQRRASNAVLFAHAADPESMIESA
jgi:hypothetical protein